MASKWKSAVSKVQEANSSGAIKVCVRLRPFNKRELQMDEVVCVEMPSETDVWLQEVPGSSDPAHTKTFTFDRAYWSFDPDNQAKFHSQEHLMNDLGQEMVQNSLNGYNCCLFAYGQTGAGKTWSILGAPAPDLLGLLPRIIDKIFDQMISDSSDPVNPISFSCSATYMEIYNEQVIDLLRAPDARTEVLSVRRNPQVGVYVEGLKNVPVFEKKEVQELLDFGVKTRSVGETCMNAASSRSHCIFTLETRRKKKSAEGVVTEVTSRLNIVDLAGSERQGKTQASGGRLKEGAAINKSLSALALVITKLAELAGKGDAKNADFVPFRNSKLTFVLQDSLSGNSKTVMIAALSPALNNYEENLSTLRFAQSVKKVKTKASKNEAKEGAMLDNLKAEVARLKAELLNCEGSTEELSMREDIRAVEDLTKRYERDLEAQRQEAQAFASARKDALLDMGLELAETTDGMGMQMKMNSAHLVNLDYDPSLAGSLIYFVPRSGSILVGSGHECHAKFMGLGTFDKMAALACDQEFNVSITPYEGRILVNGQRITSEQELFHGDRVIFGYASCFYLVIPGYDDADSMPGLDVALSEVMHEHTEAYEKCYWYIEQLQNRLGTTRAQLFTKQFRKTALLVDEANAITEEMRPMDRLEFVVEVLVDIFKYQEEVPQCVVRLKKWDTGACRFRQNVQKVIDSSSTTKANLAFVEKQFRPSFMGLPPLDAYESVALLNAKSLTQTVQQLRECYGVFCRNGRVAPDFALIESDPWRDIPSWEVEALIRSRVAPLLNALAPKGQGFGPGEEGFDGEVYQDPAGLQNNALPQLLAGLNVQSLQGDFDRDAVMRALCPPRNSFEGAPLGLPCDSTQSNITVSSVDDTENNPDERRRKKGKSKKASKRQKAIAAQVKAAAEVVDSARGELLAKGAKLQELELEMKARDAVLLEMQELACSAQLHLQSVRNVSREVPKAAEEVHVPGPANHYAPRWCLSPVAWIIRHALKSLE